MLGNTRTSWTVYPDERFRRATIESQSGGVWNTTGITVNHYGNDTDDPRWISEPGGAVTRYVSGGSGLVASTSATGNVRLALTNLHSDVVVALDTALTTVDVSDFDEFGLPAAGQAAHRYGWLGGQQRSADTLSGAVLMGVRLYSPALGRFLQVDPIPGGSATAYDYCFGDPVNCSDTDGRSWWSKTVNGLKAAGDFVGRNAGTWGTIVGTVSMFLPPPADLIGGAVGIGLSVIGAGYDFTHGKKADAIWSLAGCIPGVGAVAKGRKAWQAEKLLKAATSKVEKYVPKYGSKAGKKLLVNAMQKARTSFNYLSKKAKPWVVASNVFGWADTAKWTYGFVTAPNMFWNYHYNHYPL